jgi:hypothetical protein
MEKVWSEDNRGKTKELQQRILIVDCQMDRLEGKNFDLIKPSRSESNHIHVDILLIQELQIVYSPKSGTGGGSCETACIDGCINVHGGREKVSLQ